MMSLKTMVYVKIHSIQHLCFQWANACLYGVFDYTSMYCFFMCVYYTPSVSITKI